MKKQEIIVDGNVFVLHTKGTTYMFRKLPSGQLEHLYYGSEVEMLGQYEAVFPKVEFVEGNLNAYDEEYKNIGLENRCLECSTKGKGDIREPMIELVYENGSCTSDFMYLKHQIIDKQPLETLPSSYDDNKKAKTLVVTLQDRNYSVKLQLLYTVFYESDMIVRSAKIINDGEAEIKIDRGLSCQLDLEQGNYIFTTFTGAWAREMERQDTPCCMGNIIVNDSKTGGSSNRNNPFVMISHEETSENAGACYGYNLIYSGNHYEAMEVNGYGMPHFVAGINPFGFQFALSKGQVFEAPEAVLTYSERGFQGVSTNMHAFIRQHIVRGIWKYKERPVLLNSWEASYFNFDERKLLRLAKAGAKVGVELFVLDDGWFGNRNDDTSSLGDWYENSKKLPSGLKGLADKIKGLGMDFGIWVEPEMISENSECYRNHPDYAVEIPGQRQSLGRNQMVMDLTKFEVQEYIIVQISNVLSSADISYVKWDMNRIISDAYSTDLSKERQGEFYHRYIMGLYHVMNALIEKFPDVLFESCASGGNRFDLGMLCYMPQVWASDNTDAICRADIQSSYSYAYPMSVIGAHVSGCPNHQTLRSTSLDTRFHVACFGILGYECNIANMSRKDQKKIQNQITWYKKYRKVLQFGIHYRIQSENGKLLQWITVSEDKKSAIGLSLQKQVRANSTYAIFKAKGLDKNKVYHFTNVPMTFDLREFGDLVNTVSPFPMKQNGVVHNAVSKVISIHSENEDYLITGDALQKIGVRLSQGFAGLGYNEHIRPFQDYASRLYVMEEVNKR